MNNTNENGSDVTVDPADMTFEQAAQYCRELERQREKLYRTTEQGAFEAAFRSLDTLNDSFDDPTKIYAFSDHGLAAAAIDRYMDGEGTIRAAERCIDRTRKKIARVNKNLLRVFYLVLKNGTNREQSIWELVKDRAKSSRNQEHGTRHECSTCIRLRN